MRALPSTVTLATNPVQRLFRLQATLQSQPSTCLRRQSHTPVVGVRYTSTESILESGHIDLGPKDGALFINSKHTK
jgi:hypothetical protein